jgi:photosystem II stability/assembly factor-like uncharacterized protein
MTRSEKSFHQFYLMLAGMLCCLAVYADHHIDVDYAEQMPLAPESLLLDITRAGNTIVAVGERGHIILSRDLKTWTQAEHVPTRSTLTTVFSRGKRLWAAGHDAVILTSGDSGVTWTLLNFDPDRQQAVMDIYFTDEEHGVVIGSYGLYMTTSDGGQTWEDQTVDPEIDYHLNSLVDLGDGKWLIAGEAGYSYRSYDAGQTWEPIDMPYTGSMWGAIRSNDECVLFFGLRGHVLETCDFGTSWTEIETGSEASVNDGAVYKETVLLAANSGTLLIRDDSGKFNVYHHSSGVDFAAVISLDDGRFLLVGEDGVHHYPETSDG